MILANANANSSSKLTLHNVFSQSNVQMTASSTTKRLKVDWGRALLTRDVNIILHMHFT